jgi:cysteine-rich repeat protein
LLDSVANPHPTAGWWAFTIAIAGPRLLVNSSEGVDVYDHSTSTLIHTITSPETTSSGIGWAMTAIGNSVVFGAPFGDGAAYVYAPCGDGNQDPGEECDDTNTMGGDGCSATCQTE